MVVNCKSQKLLSIHCVCEGRNQLFTLKLIFLGQFCGECDTFGLTESNLCKLAVGVSG